MRHAKFSPKESHTKSNPKHDTLNPTRTPMPVCSRSAPLKVPTMPPIEGHTKLSAFGLGNSTKKKRTLNLKDDFRI